MRLKAHHSHIIIIIIIIDIKNETIYFIRNETKQNISIKLIKKTNIILYLFMLTLFKVFVHTNINIKLASRIIISFVSLFLSVLFIK
jgi:hypothetical protein